VGIIAEGAVKKVLSLKPLAPAVCVEASIVQVAFVIEGAAVEMVNIAGVGIAVAVVVVVVAGGTVVVTAVCAAEAVEKVVIAAAVCVVGALSVN